MEIVKRSRVLRCRFRMRLRQAQIGQEIVRENQRLVVVTVANAPRGFSEFSDGTRAVAIGGW